MNTNVSTKSYATKSNAKRALKSICKACAKHSDEIISKNEDGRFILNEDLIEKHMSNDEWKSVWGEGGSGDLPDETIKPSDEAKLAAVLDVEEDEPIAAHTLFTAPVKPASGRKSVPHDAQKTSMKLDRMITCVENGEVYKNAHQMWKANPTWMTSAQQDVLTRKLYTAAKQGDQIVVGINDRHFELVNVK